MTTRIRNCLLLLVHLCLIYFSKIEADCRGNGLMNNCACNFIGACSFDARRNKFTAFTGSAGVLRRNIPDLTPLAMTWPTTRLKIAEICEPGDFGIIYDCNNRIPLAATVIMTADQYNHPVYKRPTLNFKQSSNINMNFQQNDDDYKEASKRILCYESFNGNYYIESEWYATKRTRVFALLTACHKTGPPENSPVHRGHLVAANYGRGTPGLIRSAQTFVYTNAVPQFGVLNSGQWRRHESKLIEWARKNCGSSPLHVIVGCIPSTHPRNTGRFFGRSGFSDFTGRSRLFPGRYEYRVNVPSHMWTAACCHSPSSRITRSTTFFAANLPGRFPPKSFKLSDLFSAMRVADMNLFPGMASCNDDNNFIQI